MKWMIASDLHGSAHYTEKLLKAFEQEGCGRLLLLGDLLYHGPRNDLPEGYAPKKVIELLNSYKHKILCVRGNCEAEVDQMVLEFPVLADYCILCEGETVVYATHGHIFSEDKPPRLQKGEILLNGHTHIPACVEKDGWWYLNPGSVSIPKNGSHHGYMIWENGSFVWKDLDGNFIMKKD